MKLVFVLLDSLNRSVLGPYGGNAIATPAFDRLAGAGVTFDRHYVGSLPCMPARRDLLTGRLNFLHRSWGPIEPFDVTFPARLSAAGVYTHLISDHYHYWEEGGCGYHNQYSSAEFVRGQERDLWKAMVCPPVERFRNEYHPMLSGTPRRFPNMVNRAHIRDEADYPIARCVRLASEFLEENHAADNWLLQLELFDPHEPFTAPRRFRESLKTGYEGPVLDWPLYDRLDVTHEEAAELRANYLAVIAMCDHYLGQLLDEFDRHGLWEDTALVLTTDHGFLLGEHDWWGKNRMPMYDAVSHIPLMVVHPDLRHRAGEHCEALTQCLDVPATILDSFGLVPPEELDSHSLLKVAADGKAMRERALFGIFGGALNVTDGRHVYFRYPEDPEGEPLNEYTLMPVHPASYFTRDELADAELVHGFRFADGMPLLRVPARDDARRPPMQGGALADPDSVVYDLLADPGQMAPMRGGDHEDRMVRLMRAALLANEAPPELLKRFGLTQ